MEWSESEGKEIGREEWKTAMVDLCHAILALNEGCDTLQVSANFSKAHFVTFVHTLHSSVIDTSYIACARLTLRMHVYT